MFVDPGAIVRSEFIYRDPPTPSCHASTIAEVRPGELVAAWFGGTAEGRPDVGIYLARCVNGEWGKPVEVANGNPDGRPKYSCYNPVLFQPRKGPLLLFYKAGTEPAKWWGVLMRSQDGGKSWDKPIQLPKGVLGPIKNPPIELPGGELLCPSSTEHDGWRVHFERTPDFGATWTATPPLNDTFKISAIQPSILRVGNRKLKAIGRTRQGQMFAIDSDDAGKTWGEMRLIDVPNPNSGTDAINLQDGRFLLEYNHSTTHRTPLNVAISTDAEHWKSVLTLEKEPGEYSYPTAIQTSDGLVHITYTWRRTRIRHVVVDPTKLGLF
jgi:predicted neuraminidase